MYVCMYVKKINPMLGFFKERYNDFSNLLIKGLFYIYVKLRVISTKSHR